MAVKFILILALLQLVYAAPGPDPVPDPDVHVNVEQKVDTSCGCCNCDCDDNKEFSGAEIIGKFTEIAKLVDLPVGGWTGICDWFGPWCRQGRIYPGDICPNNTVPMPTCYAWSPPFNLTCCWPYFAN